MTTSNVFPENSYLVSGLTKREHFASMFLASLIGIESVNPEWLLSNKDWKTAVQLADKLLEELAK